MTLIRYVRRPMDRRAAPARLIDLADNEFEGYASLFNVPDSSGDIVMPGAFANSLRRRPPEKVRMLYQHLTHEPIGVWEEIREDPRGLYVRGRLVLDVTRARDVRSLIADGALDGLSIGFRTVRARRDAKSGTRLLNEIELWEISVVTFPLLAGSLVTAVGGKSAPLSATIRKAALHLQTELSSPASSAKRGEGRGPRTPRLHNVAGKAGHHVFQSTSGAPPGSPSPRDPVGSLGRG